MPAVLLGCTETDARAPGIVMERKSCLRRRAGVYLPGRHARWFHASADFPRRADLRDGRGSTGRDLPKGGMPKHTAMPPDGPPSTGQRQPAVASALADLAARLKIGEGQIAVKSVEAVDWPDASLGCAQRGRMYAQVITPGYRILLEAGGKVYEYHASQTHAVLCSR